MALSFMDTYDDMIGKCWALGDKDQMEEVAYQRSVFGDSSYAILPFLFLENFSDNLCCALPTVLDLTLLYNKEKNIPYFSDIRYLGYSNGKLTNTLLQK